MPLLRHTPPRVRVAAARPRYPRAASVVIVVLAACNGGGSQPVESDASPPETVDASSEHVTDADGSMPIRPPAIEAGNSPRPWHPTTPAYVKLSEVTTEGGIDGATGLLSPLSHFLLRCYGTVLVSRDKPDARLPRIRLSVVLSVSRNGVVSEVLVKPDTNKALLNCITPYLQMRAFDPPKKGKGRVKFRLDFASVPLK